MTKEKIQQAYNEARRYSDSTNEWGTDDIVQIALQICHSGEVLYDDNNRVIRIQ